MKKWVNILGESLCLYIYNIINIIKFKLILSLYIDNIVYICLFGGAGGVGVAKLL